MTHEKYLYSPLRQRGHTVEVYTCFETKELPKGMPAPTKHFVFGTEDRPALGPGHGWAQDHRLQLCMRSALDLKQNKGVSSVPLPEFVWDAAWPSRIPWRWVIRLRPDVVFFDFMPPLPEMGAVFAPILGGNLHEYPGVDSLTYRSLSWDGNSFRNCTCAESWKTMTQRECNAWKNPCMTITDQVAYIPGPLSPAYFSLTNHPIEWSPRADDPTAVKMILRRFGCYFFNMNLVRQKQKFVPEGRLNYRLREAGAIIRGVEFPYFLYSYS